MHAKNHYYHKLMRVVRVFHRLAYKSSLESKRVTLRKSRVFHCCSVGKMTKDDKKSESDHVNKLYIIHLCNSVVEQYFKASSDVTGYHGTG